MGKYILELKDIKKDYKLADNVVPALKGVSMAFRHNEFVSILGPSGCGKTTMLNIIGGLDQYTSGDLIIKGQSTKNLKVEIGIHIATIQLVLFFRVITSFHTFRFWGMLNLLLLLREFRARKENREQWRCLKGLG